MLSSYLASDPGRPSRNANGLRAEHSAFGHGPGPCTSLAVGIPGQCAHLMAVLLPSGWCMAVSVSLKGQAPLSSPLT